MALHQLDTHFGGWRPQLYDQRDYQFLPTIARQAVPTAFELSGVDSVPKIDQAQQGACTGHGTDGIVMYDLIVKQGGPATVMSRAMIYYDARIPEGTTGYDSGATVRDAVAGVVKYGVCTEAEFPYNDQVCDVAPSAQDYSDAAKDEALVYEAVNWPYLNGTIASGFPIVFGFTVYESFESQQVAETGVVPIPKPGEQVLGGHCLIGDTPIPLLSGETPTIAELSERDSEAWVYSATPDGKVVPGRIARCWLTRRNAELVRVVLDDGESFVCTPDHRVMLRDGTYREAGKLRSNDSLMPLYRRLSENEMEGYEEIRQPKTGRWNFTHRLVAAATMGGYPRGTVIHHDDFDKRNNDPTNLVPMTWEAHTLLHAVQADLLRDYAQSERGRARSRELMSALWADPEWRESVEARRAEITSAGGCASRGVPRNLTDEQRRVIGERGLRYVALAHTPEARRRMSETIRRRLAEDPALREDLRQRALAASAVAATRPVTEAQREARRRNAAIARSHKRNNHKVAAVERLRRTADVYDLSVPGHHNFAVGAGVFVHNCVWMFGYNATYSNWTAPSGRVYPPRTKACRNSWTNSDGSWWGANGDFFMPQWYFGPGDSNASDFWVINRVGAKS